ncbi:MULTISPECIES: LysM peptidoglycan-binding domain-containing protein [Spirosoma]|uniref:LysM peptidoglycan-binding domain-containing protein n=1 Tax=Spirosoma sordidisoli TaxID=2502893 RepID=A0A4Q2UKF1_9BACT|nr:MULTISPECIES: LysM peptidoglycan-binding domain-containing protein [Spirosoma]RYC67279.1 LysM peptidoglycan-binding domain-containing protein [Spirosoma sordidisoli]
MEEQPKNPRPTGSNSLPALTLVVLVGLIAALLYVGYDYFVDNTDGSDELTNVALDTTSQQPLAQTDPDMLMAPEEVDTSSQPAPVDLSQAEPPAGVADASAQPEEVAEDNRETTAGKPAPADEKPAAAAPKPEKPVEKPKDEKPKDEKPKEEKKVEKPKTEVAVVEKPKVKPGGVTNTHTVGSGETFYGVANRYNMKINTLKELNPGVTEQQIKAGVTKLNVKVMAVHTVGPGDVLRVVAQKYGVSKEALMRANRKDKDIATRGEKLIIPFPEKQ